MRHCRHCGQWSPPEELDCSFCNKEFDPAELVASDPQEVESEVAATVINTNESLHLVDDPLIGQCVGNFRFLHRLGQGGWGAVYEGVHTTLARPVAIKVLHAVQGDSTQAIQRFQREARLLQPLSHQSLAQVYDFGLVPGHGYYLVMELVVGKDIFRRLKTKEPFSLQRLKGIFGQLCDVLGYLHQNGVLHRDIKPGNIILQFDPDGGERAVLVDFGIAAVQEHTTQLTAPGVFLGTASYAAPEQINGSTVDERSDLYALATLLFRVLVGRPPFVGSTPQDMLLDKLTKPAPMLRDIAPQRGWSPALESFLASALALAPEQRPQDAQGFWRGCERALDAQILLEGGAHQGSLSDTVPWTPDFSIEELIASHANAIHDSASFGQHAATEQEQKETDTSMEFPSNDEEEEPSTSRPWQDRARRLLKRFLRLS